MSDALRVAIVHYHLRGGGVTRVIEHALSAALTKNVKPVVLHGDRDSSSPALEHAVAVAGLEYASQESFDDVSGILADMRTAAHSKLGAQPDVWHFHNHSLGKTLIVPRLVQRMSEEGDKLLLQIHDFPEDGRPDLYRQLLQGIGSNGSLGHMLYPRGSHVHYAALNSRDLEFIIKSGADRANAHLLPNPVQSPTDALTTTPDNSRPLVLYATRAIRRKNIGEFLLWAALSDGESRYGITSAPESPIALQHYRRWQDFADELRLPVEFNMGAAHAFPDLIAQSSQLVTTSVAEGFGLAFLEPWLANRFLAGRNLPDITRDFSMNGVNLDHLYERLDVPLQWIGQDILCERLQGSLQDYYAAYGRPFPQDSVVEALSAMSRNGMVDFGRLDETMQERIITQVHHSPDARREILPRTLAQADSTPGLVDQNRITIQNAFDLESYGAHLALIYGVVAASPVEKPRALSAELMLEAFLDPKRFTLLRT